MREVEQEASRGSARPSPSTSGLADYTPSKPKESRSGKRQKSFKIYKDESAVNPGWASLGFLIVSLLIGLGGFNMIGSAITNVFSEKGNPMVDFQIGIVILGIAAIGLLISIATAGAGIAVRRGIVPAWIVVIVFVMPIIYLVFQILLGLPSLSGLLPPMTPQI